MVLVAGCMLPEITRIDSREFKYELSDVATDHNGFNLVYAPGETTARNPRRRLSSIHSD
jgi:hypothetical protein